MDKILTKYRLFAQRTLLADYYLQFEYTYKKRKWFGWGKEVEITEWRYIPDERYTTITGAFLYQDLAPSSLLFYSLEHRMLRCFMEQESFKLIPFTKNYPDIEVYFEELREKRKKYLQEKRLREANYGTKKL